jgi:hypothetical protein
MRDDTGAGSSSGTFPGPFSIAIRPAGPESSR